MCEQAASQLVAIATRSDTGSHNRLDMIQSLVPPHYVCNGYISWRLVLLVEDDPEKTTDLASFYHLLFDAGTVLYFFVFHFIDIF